MIKEMKIGSFVWHTTNGLLRFGTVTGKTIDEKGWAYYTVSWHDDARYQYAMNAEGTPELALPQYQYRVDELALVETGHLSEALSGHTQFRPAYQDSELPAC